MSIFMTFVAFEILSSVTSFRALSGNVTNFFAVVAFPLALFSWLPLLPLSFGALSGHMSGLLAVVALGSVVGSGLVGSFLSFSSAVSGHVS